MGHLYMETLSNLHANIIHNHHELQVSDCVCPAHPVSNKELECFMVTSNNLHQLKAVQHHIPIWTVAQVSLSTQDSKH